MIPVHVLSVEYLANASPALCRALGAPEGYPSLALLTTDSDDPTYIALDEATKAAEESPARSSGIPVTGPEILFRM